MSWTITQEVKDTLRKIADERIPATELKGKNGQPIPIVQRVTSDQMIEKGFTHISSDGIPNKQGKGKAIRKGSNKYYYLHLGNKKLDHYPALEKAWLRGGYNLVNELYAKLIKK